MSHLSFGEAIPALLEARGIDTVFGIPGVHTIELYRGLAKAKLRHITPRHEQGAGFMADGYARATGRPAACFIITGPGVLNIATAMGQALGDSIPMLVIATLNPRGTLGRGGGRLHELKGQSAIGRELARFHQVIHTRDQFAVALDEAFAMFAAARPGPALIEIPLDLLNEPFDMPPAPALLPGRPQADSRAVEVAADLLNKALAPLVIAGGGAIPGWEKVRALLETLGAPTLSTVNGKGILPPGHPLDAGGCLLTPALAQAIAEADVVLAVGTELGETDFWYDQAGLRLGGAVIRVDIDPGQLNRNAHARLPILSDAGAFAEALLPRLSRRTDDAARALAIKDAGLDGFDPRYLRHRPLLERLWSVLPEAIIAADSTTLSYAGDHLIAPPEPRRWMSAATGFGTLGYALPAAIGVKAARPAAPVVCIIGDGGLHFTLPELAAARAASLPVIVLLWNDSRYGEIEHHMRRAGVEPVGIELYPTDFGAVAKAFGAHHREARNQHEVESALVEASRQSVSTIIEMKAGDYEDNPIRH